MGFIQFSHGYDDIISLENLLLAWREFQHGKKNKKDVQDFQHTLFSHVLILHENLKNQTYTHGGYEHFKINDPKPRDIHKATVRDRLLHHTLYRKLYPFFDRIFITDSYSCRDWKGTHKALDRFAKFGRQVSCNNRKTVWVLKCDIRKFFASINHRTILSILQNYISDKDTIFILRNIIESFSTSDVETGLPLGNLTSQLLVNIYMNEFDQYVKHRIKAKYYIRYADDFVFMSRDRKELESILRQVEVFLKDNLRLYLHPDKVFIKTLASGVDFLGWVHFPTHRVLRTMTKRRMFKNLEGNHSTETVQSYFGLLSHGNAWKLRQSVQVFSPQFA